MNLRRAHSFISTALCAAVLSCRASQADPFPPIYGAGLSARVGTMLEVRAPRLRSTRDGGIRFFAVEGMGRVHLRFVELEGLDNVDSYSIETASGEAISQFDLPSSDEGVTSIDADEATFYYREGKHCFVLLSGAGSPTPEDPVIRVSINMRALADTP